MAIHRLVILRTPCVVGDGYARLPFGQRQAVSATRAAALQHVIDGGATYESVVERLAPEEREALDLSDSEGLLGEVPVEIPDDVDVLLIEQGYGGVFVHSVELFRQLRARWNCLLLSPVEPLFEPRRIDGVLSLERLREAQPELNFYAWFQIMRSVTKLCAARLQMIMHRSQSLFLFDMLKDRKTVIYCDGFYDSFFRHAEDFRIEDTPSMRKRLLRELHYCAANSGGDFMGIAGNPDLCIHQMTAGAFSLRDAVENWCWGADQQKTFFSAFPERKDQVRLMVPFTNPSLFRPAAAQRDRRVLFTTTMHNIDKKGLPELVLAMSRLRKVEVDCIVRQPKLLPRIPDGVRGRMNIRSVPKPEMTDLYHTSWVNFRVSREESSPMSILESMTCELPQIVSNRVAEQIPIMEDGATGYVLDPDDKERTVWALKTLLGDERLRNRMGRECRRRAMTLSYDERKEHFERLLA